MSCEYFSLLSFHSVTFWGAGLDGFVSLQMLEMYVTFFFSNTFSPQELIYWLFKMAVTRAHNANLWRRFLSVVGTQRCLSVLPPLLMMRTAGLPVCYLGTDKCNSNSINTLNVFFPRLKFEGVILGMVWVWTIDLTIMGHFPIQWTRMFSFNYQEMKPCAPKCILWTTFLKMHDPTCIN